MSDFYTNVVHRNGKIYARGYLDGKRYKNIENYKPYLFIPTKEKSKYKSIHGQPMKRMDFANIREAKNFFHEYKDVENFNIYGMENFDYLYIYDHYRNQQPDTRLIKSAIIDIEVDSEDGMPDIERAEHEITAITIDYDDIVFAFSTVDFVPPQKHVRYIKCKDEKDILVKFLKLMQHEDWAPDVISGWYIEGFDIPYTVNRIIRLLGEDAARLLSPWARLESKSVYINGRQIETYVPVGVAILDYMLIYKKFVGVRKPQPTYSLNHIANVELGEEKLDYSNYGNLNRLFKENPQLFMEYNVRDCDLVRRIDKKQNLFDLVYYIAYNSMANFTDALGTVRAWDAMIHAYLMDQNIVISKAKRGNVSSDIAGGFVKSPLAGLHKWVMSFDLTSLYPHLIMQYNIGPDTVADSVRRLDIDMAILENPIHEYSDYIREHNVAMAANGFLYKKDHQSFLSGLMDKLFNERDEVKKQMLALKQRKEETGDTSLDYKISELDVRQYAIKVQLNSAYGALGNKYFRWYDFNMAESITLSGQLTIKWAEHKINEMLNKLLGTTDHDYVITVDTDSVYVNMEKLVEKHNPDNPVDFLDEFGHKFMEPFFDKIYGELAEQMNAYRQAMHMKREAIADRGVFTAKKRYMLNVLDNEGVRYTTPDIKIVGIESVKSSTPSSCKDMIKEAIRIILNETEKDVQNYIEDCKQKFKQQSFADIAFPRSVNNLEKYADRNTIYTKGTPIAVRGALLYNHHIKFNKLHKKYKLIFEGEKIKYCYMKLPNPINENIIAVPEDSIPTELDLDGYIDYDTQFEKAFLEPVRAILEKIGWREEEIITLEDMFE